MVDSCFLGQHTWVGEHKVENCVHVGHLHSGPVEEEPAFDGLERVGATPRLAQLLEDNKIL